VIDYVKRIFKHTTFYGISNIFLSLTAFILIPLYTLALLPKEYGIYAIITLFGSVVFYVYDMGIISALIRHYLDFDTSDIEKRKMIASTAFWFFAVTASIFSTFLIWSSGRMSLLILGSRNYAPLIQLMVAIIFLKTVSGVSITMLRIQERSSLFMSLFIFQGLGIIGFSYLFLLVLKRGIFGVFESMLLATFIFATLSIIFTYRNYGFSFSFSYLAKMLKYGLPLCSVLLFTWVIDFSDRYFLKYFLTLNDVGIYSLAYKFGQIVYMAMLSFLMAWGPILFDIVKKKKAQEVLARLSTYVVAAFVLVTLAVSLFSRELVLLMTDSAYHNSHKVIPLISFSYYLFGIYMLFLSGILVSKQVLKQPVILGSAAAVNILLNIILIPAMGIIGAAIATVITYFFVVCYTYVLAQRSYPIPYELKRLTLITIMGGIIYSFTRFITTDSMVQAILIKLVIFSSYPVILFALGIFSKQEVRRAKEALRRI